MDISNIPTSDLIEDYKKLEQLEAEYYFLCKKYNDNYTYESDESFYYIIQELGNRQVYGIDVKTLDIENSSEIQKKPDTKGVDSKK